ncbi:MAG: xanthine dehydrogenase small subunit [Pseudomonadota bacterium]|nr:xanthine dehydrogenase small subunit [Pseudomonadota bacterium]
MNTAIRFYLNGKEQHIDDVKPDTTLLNWLRLEKRLTGTKEGCAEGDCGACTVVVASLNASEQIIYKAVNACILFLPMLDGLSITTVEGLRQTDGALHIVQDAIVTHHGAQCGFCTPGFVMSLYAGYENGLDDNRQQIQQILSGNLCRCTGYGALIDAGQSAARHKPSPQEQATQLARRDDERRYLKMRQKETEMLAIETEDQAFYAPKQISELEDLTARFPDATFLAGGTDIGLLVTKQHRQINRFIYLGAVDALKSITRDDTSIHIGAAVSHAEAMDILAKDFPGLGEVWQRFGSAQVRYSGTVAGNIANGSPIGDISPCFLALGAELTLNHAGQKRRLSLDDFFISYGKQDRKKGEFIESITVPRLGANETCHAYKISKRFDQDISAVLMASKVRLDGRVIKDIRIGFGGVAATPSRAHEVEQVLAGHDCDQPLPEQATAALARDFQPISDMRASKKYRLLVAENLLQKMLVEIRENDGVWRLYPSSLTPSASVPVSALDGPARRKA